MPSQVSPSGCCGIQQIICSDTRWSIREVSVNIWKEWTQEGDPF
jgi:hypothetical protein